MSVNVKKNAIILKEKHEQKTNKKIHNKKFNKICGI